MSVSFQPVRFTGFLLSELTSEAYLRILAGTYPPPPIAIMRFGLNSLRILGAAVWQSLWICWMNGGQYL